MSAQSIQMSVAQQLPNQTNSFVDKERIKRPTDRKQRP